MSIDVILNLFRLFQILVAMYSYLQRQDEVRLNGINNLHSARTYMKPWNHRNFF